MRDLNKFRGCLLGGAVGDALGYAVEFLHIDQIYKKYGPNGITRYDLDNTLHAALISDDTQMTLFTATGLLLGTTRGMMRGIVGSNESYIRLSYKDWFRTQTETFPLPKEYHYSWLVNVPQLFSRRSPGNTCLSALGSEEIGSIEHPINRSKGCGGVMRVAPIGVYGIDNVSAIEDVDQVAAKAAAITHGHELGYIPAAALVHIIYLLASGQQTEILPAVRDAMAAMQRLFPEAKHMLEFLDIMKKAIALAQTDIPDADAIHRIGGGWVAEETLAIAVYCLLKYPHDFEKAIIASVNHDGDSDSTGAVTGSILGAYLGADAIPECFLRDLELKDIIEEIADDLYQDCKMSEYDEYRDPIWESKYIRVDYDANMRSKVRIGTKTSDD